MLSGVLVGFLLSLASTAAGSLWTYFLLRGLPELPKAREREEPLRLPAGAPPLPVPRSMEGTAPPAPDPVWSRGDIGPRLDDTPDAEILQEWDSMMRALKEEKEDVFPEWMGTHAR